MANPRPSSPERLIWDSDRWPNTMPNGANRNAQTSEAIARAFVRGGTYGYPGYEYDWDGYDWDGYAGDGYAG